MLNARVVVFLGLLTSDMFCYACPGVTFFNGDYFFDKNLVYCHDNFLCKSKFHGKHVQIFIELVF